MTDTAKEGMVSSLQTIEAALGGGDLVSSAFGEALGGGEEEEEDAPDEVELDTGVTLTVVTDEEIDEEEEKSQKTCCRSVVVALAAFFILPVTNMFLLILHFSITNAQPESLTSSSTGTLTTVPTEGEFPYFCETYPLPPECREYYSRMMAAMTTPSLAQLCQDYPSLTECSGIVGRRKRSGSLCDLYPWVKVCSRERMAAERKEWNSKPVEWNSKLANGLNTMPAKKKKTNSAKNGSAIFAKEGTIIIKTTRNWKTQSAMGRSMKSAQDWHSQYDSSHITPDPGIVLLTPADHSNHPKRYRRQASAIEHEADSTSLFNQQQTENTPGVQSGLEVIEETYNIVYGLFGIVSGILVTAFNYRVTALAGCFISALGCLVGSFLPLHEPGALAFVIGVFPGIGNNFIVTAVSVALLEYFREKRLRVLSLADASSSLSLVVYFLLQVFLFPRIGIGAGDWRPLVQYQAATYIICLLASLGLFPLNLHIKDSPEDTVRGRMLDIQTSGLHLLKSPLLYALSGVFFLTTLGEGQPRIYVETASGVFILGKLLAILIAIGGFFGSLVSCCMPYSKFTAPVSVTLIAIFGVILGSLTMAVEAIPHNNKFAVAYTLLFGIFTGLRTPLMNHVIPLVMGEDHMGLIVGVLSFFTGLGSVIGEKGSAAIMENHQRVDAVFYMSGLALLVSSAVAILLLVLLCKGAETARVSSASPSEGAEEMPMTEVGQGTQSTKNAAELFTVPSKSPDADAGTTQRTAM